MVAILQKKVRAIDLLNSSSNHVAVKQELQQCYDLFKLLSTHHEEYCGLLGLEDQRNEVAQFHDLDYGVFNFKHKIYSWMRYSADKNSCKVLSKESSRSKKSSGSTKSSSSSKPFTKRNLLEEKAKFSELEAEVTFMLEKQKGQRCCKFKERLQEPTQGLECMEITTRWKSMLIVKYMR